MIKIVTHNGGFHADDVFAVAALKLYLEKTGKSEVRIIRTRDQEEIAAADYALDVGGIHDPAAGRFDHHQEAGAGERENGVPYAAFGLIWQAYGAEICGNETVAEKIDHRLVQSIDGPDNGVSLTGEELFPDAYPYFIQSAVSVFKPTWREEADQANEAFGNLVEWATVLLEREITSATDVLEGEELVEKAYESAKDKRVIYLNEDLPWKGSLTKKPEPLLVVYPKADRDIWRLQAVPEEGFTSRINFPESWRGKRGSELQAATGADSAVFCHRSLPMVVVGDEADIDELVKKILAQRAESE